MLTVLSENRKGAHQVSIDGIPAAELDQIKTESVQQYGELLQWTVAWSSTTGDLQDLAGTDVVDILTWEGLPAGYVTESGEWRSGGVRTGVGLGGTAIDAAQGRATFSYPIMPSDVSHSGENLFGDGSETWETTGILGHGVFGTYVDLDQVAIRMVRSFGRNGRDLVANCQFTDPSGSVTSFSVVTPGYFEEIRITDEELELDDDMPEAQPQTVDWSLVDEWNQAAMKAMEEGDEIRYFIFHERLLLDGVAADPAVNDYINYAKANNSGNSDGRLRMTKKGGVFGPGSVTVTWAGNWAPTIEEAIGQFSKKKVIFA